ncbi:Hypothetical protein CINCED_3A021687 [Cinara cedri]|uniref:Uncharacterized protein n=1 Tax=Cinara cedri TaxID=506608 RepID=A0A5E4N353_9HEMI|nr:Hypothetical protein CINCED_3A021687 [Cinara cedri]
MPNNVWYPFTRSHSIEEHLSCLKRETIELDELSKEKTEEVRNIHCDHSSTEVAVESITKKLFELKQRNKKEEQTIQELSVWLQEKDSQMTIKKESIIERLAKNNRFEEMARQELIDATAEVAARNEEQGNLATAYQKLKASLSAYKFKINVEIKELSDQQDQLTCAVANVSIKLAEKCDANCQLKARVKVNSNRISKILREVEKLERWVPLKNSRKEWHKKKVMIDVSCFRDLRDATREKLKLVEENYNLKQTLFQTGLSCLQKATSLLKQCPTKKLLEICY